MQLLSRYEQGVPRIFLSCKTTVQRLKVIIFVHFHKFNYFLFLIKFNYYYLAYLLFYDDQMQLFTYVMYLFRYPDKIIALNNFMNCHVTYIF